MLATTTRRTTPTVPAQRPTTDTVTLISPPPPPVPSGPERPGFFGRRGVQLLGVGLGALIIGVVIGSNTNGNTTSQPANAAQPASSNTVQQPAAAPAKQPASTQTHASAPKKPAAAPVSAKPSDKGWVVQSLNVKRDFVGAFDGTVRLTNSNDSSRSGAFTITLFRSGKQIGVLQGTADDVVAGKTVTVSLVSEDHFSAGSFSYDFQADLSF
jgi:hypothetical protein